MLQSLPLFTNSLKNKNQSLKQPGVYIAPGYFNLKNFFVKLHLRVKNYVVKNCIGNCPSVIPGRNGEQMNKVAFLLLYYLGSILIGYLLGCSNMAFFIGKIKGIDLRSGGSRNLGASNAFIMLGIPYAILVGAHDIGKAFLAVWLAKNICVWNFGTEIPYVGLLAGLACVYGHIFPFYLKFKGGKGTAAFVGMSFASHWMLGVTAVLLILICTLVTRYIVVGTAATILAIPIASGFLLHSRFVPFIFFCATAVIAFKHRKNFIRIYKGTEIPLYGPKPTQEEVDNV